MRDLTLLNVYRDNSPEVLASMAGVATGKAAVSLYPPRLLSPCCGAAGNFWR